MRSVVHLYYSYLDLPAGAPEWEALRRLLPANMLDRIDAYRNPGDRLLRLLGKSLLRYALRQNGHGDRSLAGHYRHLPGEKPFVEQVPGSFSISHSGALALCAWSSLCQIGVDAELRRPVDLSLLRGHFDALTWEKIISDEDPQRAFYRQWTFREAALKAAGTGIAGMEPDNIFGAGKTLSLNGQPWQAHHPDFADGYAVCVATPVAEVRIEPRRVSVAELLAPV